MRASMWSSSMIGSALLLMGAPAVAMNCQANREVTCDETSCKVAETGDLNFELNLKTKKLTLQIGDGSLSGTVSVAVTKEILGVTGVLRPNNRNLPGAFPRVFTAQIERGRKSFTSPNRAGFLTGSCD